MTTSPFADSALFYEIFFGDISRGVWRDGVLAEVGRLWDEVIVRSALDLASGTCIGRRLLLSSFPSLRVTCVDSSSEMLAQSGVPESDRHIADIADFDLGRSFDIAVCGFGGLNYLSRQRIKSFFGSAARALRPGGLLIFDYSSPVMLKEAWGDCVIDRTSGNMTMRNAHKWDSRQGNSVTELTFMRNGVPEWRERHILWSFPRDEIAVYSGEEGFGPAKVRNLGSDNYSPQANAHVYVMALGSQVTG